MDSSISHKTRERLRVIRFTLCLKYERLEYFLNYPIELLRMKFIDKEESIRTQSVKVLDLDELDNRLSKGYRLFKKIRTSLNLKDDWDFIKLKILFLRQYYKLYVDSFDPETSYSYLNLASALVENREKMRKTAQGEDLSFYRYLVEIDRSNFYIMTGQHSKLISQYELYLNRAQLIEQCQKKPISVLVPFRIYIGCAMILDLFKLPTEQIVSMLQRGVKIIENNEEDVGRYFLREDVLIYVTAYSKIIKLKIKLKYFSNAKTLSGQTLRFIQKHQNILKLPNSSKIILKLTRLLQKAQKEQQMFIQFQKIIYQNEGRQTRSIFIRQI